MFTFQKLKISLTGLAAMLLFCFASPNQLISQCSISCPAGNPTARSLVLDNTGNAVLDASLFGSLITSNCQLTPPDYPEISIWEDAGATVAYPTNLEGPNFDCTDIGDLIAILYVTVDDGSGQSGTCSFAVTIADNIIPVIDENPGGANPASVFVDPGTCASVQTLTATVEDNCPNNLTLEHILTGATTGTFNGFTATHVYNEGTTTITWRVTDNAIGGTVYTESITLNVIDNEDPEFVGGNPAGPVGNLTANGMCQQSFSVVAPAVSDNCGIGNVAGSKYEITLDYPTGPNVVRTPSLTGQTFLETFPLGTTSVTFDVIDDNGNPTTHSYNVVVEDNTAPSFGAAPTTFTVSPAGCSSVVSLNLTSFISDNCDATPTMSHTVNGGASIAGADASGTYNVGIYTIVFTAVDDATNTNTHTVTLTVEDLIDPTAICQDVMVSVEANGMVTVQAEAFDDMSTDNCPPISDFKIRLNPFPIGDPAYKDALTFDCADIATSPINIDFRVYDTNNNTDDDNTCTITIVDTEAPTAQCKDISVNLDENTNTEHTVNATDINNASFDNCPGVLTYEVSRSFGGPFTPTVVLNCMDISSETLYLRVTDAATSMNTNICASTVTVNDVTDPVANVMAVAKNLSASNPGTVTVTPAEINNASTDNCGITQYAISRTSSTAGFSTVSVSFDCTDLTAPNPETVWLRVTDGSGNTDVKSTTVTLTDADDPVANCKDATINLDATGNATLDPQSVNNNSTDNASSCGLTYAVTPNTFNCASIAVNPTMVTLTVTDGSMRSDDCTANVTVVDNVPPVALCNNATVALLPSGSVTLTAFQLAPFSLDNCSCVAPATLTHEVWNATTAMWETSITFDCNNVATDQVLQVRVTDCASSANAAVCTAVIDVLDTEDPVFSSVPGTATVQCGTSTLPASTGGNATATDNCPGVMVDYVDVPPTITACSGTITRTWTATDVEGNTTTATQTINVVDTTNPSLTAPADKTGADALECPAGYDVANLICTTFVDNTIKLISDVGTPTVFSEIISPNLTVDGKIVDVNVSALISHTRIGDLDVEIEYATLNTFAFPAAVTTVPLFDNLCGTSQDFDLSFDDSGALYDGTTGLAYGTIPCPPTNQGIYNSENGDLGDLNQLMANGHFRLEIMDDVSSVGGGGQLNSWSVEICYVQQPATAVGSLTTGEPTTSDNCDMSPTASYTDYMAFKDFDSNSDFTAAAGYDFEFANWTASLGHASSFITAQANPSQLTLRSHTSSTANNDYTISVPANGWVSFDWTYTSNDGTNHDRFYYLKNGVPTQLNFTSQPSRILIPVNTGNSIGFRMGSDGDVNQSTAVIANFAFIEDNSCPLPALACPRKFCIGRIWDAVDDCGNNAAKRLQLIATDDTTDPVVSIPTALTVIVDPGNCIQNITGLDFSGDIADGGCSAYDDLAISYTILRNSDNTVVSVGDGRANPSGNYAPDVYTITFDIEDECGNDLTHVLTLTVLDDEAPDAQCQDFEVQLNNNGQATVNAADLDNGSDDNCSSITLSFVDQMDMSYPMSAIDVDISDLGVNPITLYVVDDAGNESTCISLVSVVGGVVVQVNDMSGVSGDMISVPVTVSMFEDVTTFSFDLDILNTAIADFATPIAIENLNSTLEANGTFTINQATGQVAWIADNLGNATTLAPPNNVLFDIKLMLNGTAGQTTVIEVNNDLVAVNGFPVSSLGLAGTVTILNNITQYDLEGDLLESPECGVDVVNFVEVVLSESVNSTLPGAAGAYSFTVPEGSNSTITPSKNSNWANGVFANDVAEILKYSVNLTSSLTNPPSTMGAPASDYKLLAADINLDGAVNVFDAFDLNQLILAPYDPAAVPSLAGLAGLESWRFVRADDPSPYPAGAKFIDYDNIMSDMLDGDFYGVKMGDVTCDGNPTVAFNPEETEDRSSDLFFVVLDEAVSAGQEFDVTMKAKDFEAFNAAQMTFGFDPAKVEFKAFTPEALTGLTDGNINTASVAQGLLPMTWFYHSPVDMQDGEALLTLRFTALEDLASLQDVIWINSDLIPAIAFKADQSTTGIDILFESTTSTGTALSSGFALYQNTPNPFANETMISFSLPQAANVTLTIMDATGKLIKQIDRRFAQGYNQVQIDRNELAASGILIYQLDTPTHSASRKMVLID